MPRARKTLTGAPAAGAVAPAGVPYGEGERRLESQRRTPVPSGPPPVPGGAPGGGGAAQAAPPSDYQAALETLKGMPPPESMLDMPTSRPNEPITTGAGPHAQTPQLATNEGLYNLRAVYKRAMQVGAPTEDLRRLIEFVERNL